MWAGRYSGYSYDYDTTDSYTGNSGYTFVVQQSDTLSGMTDYSDGRTSTYGVSITSYSGLSSGNTVLAIAKVPQFRGLGHTNSQTKVLKAATRKMVDELEDLEDLDMEEEVSEQDEETIRKNEQSEGYGSWKGLGMEESIVKSLKKDLLSFGNENGVKKVMF